MKSRRLSREAVMEIIFSGQEEDFKEDSEFLNEFTSLKDIKRKALDEEYMEKVIGAYTGNREKIDELIEKNLSQGWKAGRISRTDRAILSLGISEIIFLDDEDIPPAVSINEAIELTRKYSGEESVKFVNSVLDNIRKNKEN